MKGGVLEPSVEDEEIQAMLQAQEEREGGNPWRAVVRIAEAERRRAAPVRNKRKREPGGNTINKKQRFLTLTCLIKKDLKILIWMIKVK